MGALMSKKLFLVSLLNLLPLTAAYSAEGDSGIKVHSGGYFIVDGGYVSETEDVRLKKWHNENFYSFIGGLRLSASPTERLSVVINPELKSHNIFPISPAITLGETTQRTRYEAYLEEVKASLSFGDPDRPRGRLNFGYMIYEDNPDTKVLGSYMFRSMIYPSILFTKMDNPAAYLFGLHGSMDFLDGNFKNNAFVLSETQHYPYFDISLAYSGSYSFKNVLEVGIGVNAKSIIPIRPSRTTPGGGEGLGIVDNTYKFVPFQTGTQIKNDSGVVVKTVSIIQVPTQQRAVVVITKVNDVDPLVIDTISLDTVPTKGGGIAGLSSGPLGNKAMTQLTPSNGVGDLFPELHGTNTRYSFAGTMIGGRISVNPMGFMGESNPLGKNALKIYAEVAFLGWQNYEGYYENRNERRPIMLGINLPTFDYLDFLSVEVEQFTSTYLPTYEKRSYWNIPQPETHKGEIETLWDKDRRTKDDIKWVISAKKTLGGWGMAMQAGTDHTKLSDDSETELFDVLSRPSQWYTELRFFASLR